MGSVWGRVGKKKEQGRAPRRKLILLFHFELKGLGDSGLEGHGGIGSFRVFKLPQPSARTRSLPAS